MAVNTAEKLFTYVNNIIIFKKDDVESAKEIFSRYIEEGVIKSSSKFEDISWHTTDEYSNVGLHFKFNEVSYKKNYYSVLNIPLEDFILYVKAYVLCCFGLKALQGIQRLLLDLRHIISKSIDDICSENSTLKIAEPKPCIDFFGMLPLANEIEEIDELCKALQGYVDSNADDNKDSQRVLADFDSYFLFDEIIKDYWASDISHEDRMFYYPLYLWWKITAVIPLRPREFLLTERNCLHKGNSGEHYLRLRRNKIKGSAREISYKISDDYFVTTYKIPDELANVIETYKEHTNDFESTELDTLFVTDCHYRKWAQSKHSNSRYLTYINMNTILKYFYRDVIQNLYGLTIINSAENKHLREKEIARIHLGDTRHIALINLMQQGGTPIAAMLLAGHTNANMASHYYSNVLNLIECKTYKQYRKVLCGDVSYQVSKYSPFKTGTGTPLSDGGMCYSKAFADGDFSDCTDAIGPNSEIGYCTNCSFYRKKGLSFFTNDDIYKRHLKDDCKAIEAAVNLVRQGKGEIETIIEATMKLSVSSSEYEQYLLEKNQKENK